MYHSISDHASPKFKQFTVSPALFAEHMAYLRQQAYTPITATQLVNRLSQASQHCAKDSSPVLPERTVVLTFDDGFADFFTAALPILKLHNFVATIYVATAFVGATSSWLHSEGEAARPMLTWDQLRSMSASGIECASHTHTHPQLDLLPLAAVSDEIMQSKTLLEAQIGRSVTSISYPYGYHTMAVRRLVREAGYTSACAVGYALSTETSDPFALTRLFVDAGTSVDELAQLLTKGNTSAMTTIYRRMRTPLWRLVRQAASPMTRYAQRRYV